MSVRRSLALLAAAWLACAACRSVEPFDYTLFYRHAPRSILVLPPLDETQEVGASYAYLPTVTFPIAERGYYVFPVAVVAHMMRENGLPGPAEMHTVSLAKLDEIFGADAVLYLTLTDWGTSFQVTNSATRVTVHGRLIDVKTGTELWAGSATAVRNSNSGGGGILDAILSAMINQVVTSAFDPTETVARQANTTLFYRDGHGLPLGPYHPDFGAE